MTTTPTILPDRLAQLDTLILRHGGHKAPTDGMCFNEACAWLSGEAHSDHPSCMCPVVAKATMRLNDRIGIDDQMRTELMRPLLLKAIGTRTLDRGVMIRRGFIAADFAVRVFAPIALEKRGRLDLARRLRDLSVIDNVDRARSARDEARKVRADAAADAAAFTAAFAAAAAADADAAAAAAFAADDAGDAADAAAAFAAFTAAFAAADAAAAFAADDADAAAARKSVYVQAVRMIEWMCEVR